MDRTLNDQDSVVSENGRLCDSSPGLQIGYMRVSKSDGSQVLDLQRDALVAAGAMEDHLYEDSGRDDQRPGLAACQKLCGPVTRLSSGSSTGLAATCAI
jgi:hypothetical protein